MYYNLIVFGDENAYNGQNIVMEVERSVKEYTDPEISDLFGDFSDAAIESIKKYPCIFAYEKFIRKNPIFGRIIDVKRRRDQVLIEYELTPLDRFITHVDLIDMSINLDIGSNELFRTHWAIKNVDLAKALLARNVSLPKWAMSKKKIVDITEHSFDVALSFPGEVRDYVERVAEVLERELGPDRYFYDNNYKSQLAMPGIDTVLQSIYRNRSELIVAFIGEKYQVKPWCGLEFRAIRDILKERNVKKVMYVRTDDGQVDGILSIDGYIDAEKHAPSEVAEYILERVALLKQAMNG